MSERTDDQLIQAILDARRRRSSDTRALEDLVRRHQALVVTNCRLLLGYGPDAEDAAHEVFLKAHRSVGSVRDRSRFAPWLKRIKVNHCMDQLRRRKSRRHLDVDDPELTDEGLQRAPEVVADTEERSRAHDVRAVLDTLDEKYRLPLVMCDVDGFSYAEISEKLGIGLSATKMRIKRARELFRTRFDRRTGSVEARGPEQ